jgi:hypothetical protein
MGPRVTRKSAILDLGKDGVAMLPALYHCVEVDGDDAATRAALESKVISICSVSTGRHTAIGGGRVLLQLKFWLSENSSHPVFSIDVMTPSWWSNQMYLLALAVTIKKTTTIVPHLVASWEEAFAGGFNSLNNVHFLYNCNRKQLLSKLHAHGRYTRVQGGTRLEYF